MKDTSIAGIGEFSGKTVTLEGWLYNRRGSKKLQFLQIRDGSGTIQAVVALADVGEELFELASGLNQEASLRVTGEVKPDDRAPSGFEMLVSGIELVADSVDYPISPKDHGVDFLLENRHLWLRSSKQHALMRIRGTLISALREFFDKEGYLLVDAPIFTPSSVEGTTTLFEVEYFGDKAYLTQSGQLYMEAAAAAHGKVYCFGPTFRAEKSKTRRHLTEFWMLEPEIAFANLDDVMEIQEQMLEFVTAKVLAKHRDELERVLERDCTPLEKVKAPFPRVHYDEAIAMLKEKGQDLEWGGDFGGEDETILTKAFDRPIFVHRFPAAIKAFYMAPDPEDLKYSLSVDCLAPEGYGEIIGGGQRADNLEYLQERIAEHNLPSGPYEWYLDLRRYGSFPHAGFGIGIERTLAWLTGRQHIRECIPFPRLMHRIQP
ncbi:asparagine--tRNA ligase [bacterium]|nr:asparagine--tRNA ligase [bacterium]